jgi:hypothetical protein
MTISKDLLLAILSMDSYNRGYGSGVNGLSDSNGTLLGNVSISGTSASLVDANGNRLDQSAGFYAVAYTTTADIGDPANGGIAKGTTIISYRGTDSGGNLNADATLGGSDIVNGYGVGAGVPGGAQPSVF